VIGDKSIEQLFPISFLIESSEAKVAWPLLGSISSTFYAQLLHVQFPKAQKGTGNLTDFLHF